MKLPAKARTATDEFLEFIAAWFAVGMIGVGLLCGWLVVSEIASQSKAPTPAELCLALGRYPRNEPLCSPNRSPKDLIESVFPPGIATIDDVHGKLITYRLSSSPTSNGGTSERYILGRGGILDNAITGLFTFDEKGLLQRVSVSTSDD